MPLHCDRTYVLHYTRKPERRRHIEEQFNVEGIEATFITEFDREDLTSQQLERFYYFNPTDFWRKIRPLWELPDSGIRVLNPAEISCTIKHLEAVRRIGEECSNYGLIFEDDVILDHSFTERFNQYLAETPSDWDAIFVGSCCDLHAKNIIPGVHVYPASHPATRGCECYLLRKNIAQAIARNAVPFQLVSDWEIAYHLNSLQAKVYWWEQPLTKQGSVTGLFKSELR